MSHLPIQRVQKRKYSRRLSRKDSLDLKDFFPALRGASKGAALVDISNKQKDSFKAGKKKSRDLLSYFRQTNLKLPFDLERVLFSLKEDQFTNSAQSTSFAKQSEISPSMRSILVDWLVDIHRTFKYKEETLFLAINLLDRYLEKKTILKADFQLVGATCLLIAGKFEEIYPKRPNLYVKMSDNAFSEEELLKEEKKVLAALDFEVLTVSSLSLIETVGTLLQLDLKSIAKAILYANVALLDHQQATQQPGLLAQACLSLVCTNIPPTLLEVSQAKTAALASCLEQSKTKLEKSSLMAVFRKNI